MIELQFSWNDFEGFCALFITFSFMFTLYNFAYDFFPYFFNIIWNVFIFDIYLIIPFFFSSVNAALIEL